MRFPRIAVVHNAYQQPGGEDAVFESEAALLEQMGHTVIRYTIHNNDINPQGLIDKLKIGASTVWNHRSFEAIRTLLRRERPDIIHFHNTFPLVSPASYYAAKAESVPVVQTLHNYRLLCLNALLHRNGASCEDCVGHLPIKGIARRCYRGGTMESATVCAMLGVHRVMGTWSRAVDQYIVLSEASTRVFVRGGLPQERLSTKPNFLLKDPGEGLHRGHFALFAGRLTVEKGVRTLLEAWRSLQDDIPLRIAGDGPLADEVRAAARDYPNISYLGQLPKQQVLDLMGDAHVVIVPSECQETFGLVIIEAFAKGTPVIATCLGAAPELIGNNGCGVLVQPASPADLAAEVSKLWRRPELAQQLGSAARTRFQEGFTAEKNYKLLMGVYDRAWQMKTQQQQ